MLPPPIDYTSTKRSVMGDNETIKNLTAIEEENSKDIIEGIHYTLFYCRYISS